MEFSKTQLINYANMLAGIIALILSAFGVVVEDAKVAFILYAVFTLGASGYSFYNRFQKKDLTLSGARLVQ